MREKQAKMTKNIIKDLKIDKRNNKVALIVQTPKTIETSEVVYESSYEGYSKLFKDILTHVYDVNPSKITSNRNTAALFNAVCALNNGYYININNALNIYDNAEDYVFTRKYYAYYKDTEKAGIYHYVIDVSDDGKHVKTIHSENKEGRQHKNYIFEIVSTGEIAYKSLPALTLTAIYAVGFLTKTEFEYI